MSQLSKIRAAGFEVTLLGDSFKLAPASDLMDSHREFFRTHKPEIISELQHERLMTVCYSPNGLAYEVEARDSAHAALLL